MTTMPSLLHQRGAALITGLIFMVVLTLIALSAMKSTSLEERMSGNARDQGLAFEAAEAGVRDAMPKLQALAGNLATFTAACDNGLCLNDSATPVWETITASDDWTSDKTIAYPVAKALKVDGATPLPQQPHYIIELIPSTIPPLGESNKAGNPPTVIPFRITSRGWGATGQSQATVQAAIIY